MVVKIQTRLVSRSAPLEPESFEVKDIHSGNSHFVSVQQRSFKCLLDGVELAFGGASSITYIDDEDDVILVQSDEELAAAIEFLPTNKAERAQSRPELPPPQSPAPLPKKSEPSAAKRKKQQQQRLEALDKREKNLGKRIEGVESKILELQQRKGALEENKLQLLSEMAQLRKEFDEDPEMAQSKKELDEDPEDEILGEEEVVADKVHEGERTESVQIIEEERDVPPPVVNQKVVNQKVAKLQARQQKLERTLKALEEKDKVGGAQYLKVQSTLEVVSKQLVELEASSTVQIPEVKVNDNDKAKDDGAKKDEGDLPVDRRIAQLHKRQHNLQRKLVILEEKGNVGPQYRKVEGCLEVVSQKLIELEAGSKSAPRPAPQRQIIKKKK